MHILHVTIHSFHTDDLSPLLVHFLTLSGYSVLTLPTLHYVACKCQDIYEPDYGELFNLGFTRRGNLALDKRPNAKYEPYAVFTS